MGDRCRRLSLQFLVLSKLVFQLEIIQALVQNITWTTYIGYRSYPVKEAAFFARFDIVVLALLGLLIAAEFWEKGIRLDIPELPSDTSMWPLFPAQKLPSSAHENTTSPRSLDRIRKIARDSLAEYLHALNFWASNCFTRFGFDICLFVHAVVAMVRADVIGLIYLCFLGAWLIVGPAQASLVWRSYMVFIGCLVAFQYIASLGLPPPWGIQFPWDNLSADVLYIIGISKKLYIAPDFFLLWFCSLQQLVSSREKSRVELYQPWVDYGNALNQDYTVKPRYSRKRSLCLILPDRGPHNSNSFSFGTSLGSRRFSFSPPGLQESICFRSSSCASHCTSSPSVKRRS